MTTTLPLELREKLLQLAGKLPEATRSRFISSSAARLEELALSNTTTYAVIGAGIGAVLGMIPFVDDDMWEAGAAIGATVGLIKDKKAREERQKIALIVQEEIRNALA